MMTVTMKPKVTLAYEMLAERYDEMFEGPSHRPWQRLVREKIIGDILKRARSACDIACGTGTTAMEYAAMGVRTVYAVDLSPVMCRLAREKSRRSRIPIHVIHGDMCSFRIPEQVDVVTCEFDAINHVRRKSDLARVAHAVSRALRPGGYFFYDANNRAAFEKMWPSTWWIEIKNAVCVMHGGYDRRRDKGWTNCEWFIREGRLWRRYCERVEEVCWEPAEARRALRDAGFDQIKEFDGAQFPNPWIKPGSRSFYLARKAR